MEPLWFARPCGRLWEYNREIKGVPVSKEPLQGRKALKQNMVVEAGIEKCTRYKSVRKVDYSVDY